MVQYRNASDPASKYPLDKLRDTYYWPLNYWKLDPGHHKWNAELFNELVRRKFHFRKSSTRTRLRYLYSRVQRGLISYESFTAAELRKFCRQRGVQIDQDAKKEEILQRLESEDEDPKFGHLMDLPAELRLSIYEFSFDFCDLEGSCLPPPPLAAVSKLVRKEILPLFYDKHRLNIKLRYDTQLPSWSPFDPSCALTRDTSRFFQFARADTLQAITKLTITNKTHSFEWDVVLASRGNPHSVFKKSDEGGFDKEKRRDYQRATDFLKALLDTMAQREEGMRLRAEDAMTVQEICDL